MKRRWQGGGILLLGTMMGFLASFSPSCANCKCPELAPVPVGTFDVVAQDVLTPASTFPDLVGASVIAATNPEPNVVLEYTDEAGQPARVLFGTIEGKGQGGAAGNPTP